MLAFKMLQRSRNRTKSLLNQRRDRRNLEELLWTNRGIAAMLRREKFQDLLNHIKKGLRAKQLQTQLTADDGRLSETTRKRKIPVDQPGVVLAILRFATVRHRQLAVKWPFGRFPLISSTLLEKKYGEKVSRTPRQSSK